MVLTSGSGLDAGVRRYINHGRSAQNTHVSLGNNYRLTDLQAAIGNVLLESLDAQNALRRKNARTLIDALSAIPGLQLPPAPDRTYEPVYHHFTLRVSKNQRSALQKRLTADGIGNGIYYPTLVPHQAAYRDRIQQREPWTEALKATHEALSIPVHPSLNASDLKRIIASVRSCFR